MVNAALIAIIGILFLIGNYFLYGRYIEKKIKPTNKKTPAVLNKGKIDYYPSNKFFLLGIILRRLQGQALLLVLFWL